MAIHRLVLPKMGESVSEATIIKWLKKPGDRVEEDEAVVEIATDKVDSDVPSPVSGVIQELLFSEDAVVQVGEVLVLIDTVGEGVAADKEEVIEEETELEEKIQEVLPESLKSTSATPSTSSALPPAAGTGIPAMGDGGRFYSPLVRNIAAQEGISTEELDRVRGTGADNRVTKQDVLSYLADRGPQSSSGEPQKVERQGEASVSSPQPEPAPAKISSVSGEDEIIEMDRMRRLIADHMVNSVKTSPHVCSFVEADVTNLVQWRNKVKAAYEKREGEKITFTPIFIEAVSRAIKDFPLINVSVNGYQITKKKNINIGMATALPSGNLIVPVIKNADQLSLVGLSKSVNDLANRARENKLKPDDTQGGTFTLTNVGAFGNLTGTPIINQPQVAIMAVGTIVKKPAVIETEYGDVIGIRHKMILSLSYDHRVVDGSLGGRFVKRVADYLEAWDTNREV